jgi:hypothetical protein
MRSRDPTPGSDQRRRPDAVIVGSVPRPPVAPRALLRTLGVWRTVRAAPSLLRPLLGKRRRRRCRQGIHLHFGIVSRAQEPRQDPRRLGWVGDDLPVGKRHGGAEVPVYLCHEGGTAEDASAVPCEEPAQCRYVVCGGVANGAGGVGVQGASFASEGHRTVMVRLDDASSKGARRSIADGKPTGLRRGARLRADQGALGVSRRGGFLGARHRAHRGEACRGALGERGAQVGRPSGRRRSLHAGGRRRRDRHSDPRLAIARRHSRRVERWLTIALSRHPYRGRFCAAQLTAHVGAGRLFSGRGRFADQTPGREAVRRHPRACRR